MQFWIAMVDESDNAFTDAMKREDLQVYDFNFAQTEGDFATLDLTIENPRVGLLNAHRHQWLWFAVEHPTEGTLPLFFGRIVGLPSDLDEDFVKVQYIAKPSDYHASKTTLALTMLDAPYYDPIWFDETKPFDPDNVLEFRPALWHINPVTHAVTYSNIIAGEDGDIVLGEDDVFYDSVKLTYGTKPLTSVTMHATVSWDQKAAATLDFTHHILRGTNIVQTYTGEGFSNGWPKAGDSVGGGWSVASSSIIPTDYVAPYTLFETAWAIPSEQRKNWTPFEHFEFDAFVQPHGGLLFVKTNLAVNLTLGYDVTRRKSESISFTLYADVQPIMSDILSTTDDTETVSMSSSELNQPIDDGGEMPIRDERAAIFFSTDRGDLAIQSLLAIARAKLLARARCVDIELEIPPLEALALGVTLRKNIIFTDHRMPGAVVGGKITDYSFKLSGDDGQATFSINFKSTIGNGSTIAAVAGTPDYVEEDCFEDGLQMFTGGWTLPALGDVVYQPILGEPPNDDGIDFFRMSALQIVTSSQLHNPADVQEALFPLHGGEFDSANPLTNFPAGTWSQYYLTQDAIHIYPGYNSGSYRPEYSPSDALKTINDFKTTLELHLKDITGGPFETVWTVATSDLVIPRLIDLESSSTP